MRRPPTLDSTTRFHIVNRGVARLPIVCDDLDRQRLLGTLERAIAGSDVRVHAYCLMTNHYHLLVEGAADALPTVMKRFAQPYAQAFNTRYERVGPLFAGRYHPVPILDDGQLATVVRYIALNPMAIDRFDVDRYAWSSHGALIRGNPPDWLDTSIIDQLGGIDRYRELVDGGRPTADRVIETARIVLDEVGGGRSSRRSDVRDVVLLFLDEGDDSLAADIEQLLGFPSGAAFRKARHRARLRRDEAFIRPVVEQVQALVWPNRLGHRVG